MSRGRNRYLIRLRNEALIRRYFYWTEVKRLRFDDVLRILSEREFFISEDRIMTIVRAGSEHLDMLRLLPGVKRKSRSDGQYSLFF
jgi:hypothetical protein